MQSKYFLFKKLAGALACSTVLTLGLNSWSLAANTLPKPNLTLTQTIESSLKSGLAPKQIYQTIANQFGANAIVELKNITLNKALKDETRWTALFTLARLDGKSSLAVIRSSFSDSSWMLRDGALKTAAALGAAELSNDIAKKLDDQALIVRTTAVETIRHLKLTQYSDRLVTALYDPKNYYNDKVGAKPLWIYSHIFSTLEDFKAVQTVPRLVSLLEKSNDQNFQQRTLACLASLTGKNFSGKSLAEQIYLWKRNTLADQSF